ncbi:MAG: hypothetical protein A2756_04715 [Candidatus Ryanbacteria bacterium RIFCSPHIGHO2_01_FULL_48_27]|uniref:Uncharacterized protein n=1 Tax=Candidatus Ryanbacteria bacterium RIFCSPHIGHO2_01_FULL_48_27 TaxID=1802115 RepID=A0A1G2G454_9BACT|nr:MAG: hypothetical protein A2756_04715 [Candidatus Ryanbacteria bacterium RIFCSPHIGHO2_01_FULL_48_27]
MHKNATFLILFGTLLVAGGVVLYERQKLDNLVIPRVSQNDQQGQDNQPKDDFPTELKTDPKTGEKVFEGRGMRMRISAENLVFTLRPDFGRDGELIIQTPEDFEIEKRIRENDDHKEVYPLSQIVIEFERNTDHLTWTQWLKKVGLDDEDRIYINIDRQPAARFSGSGNTEKGVSFFTPNSAYIVSITAYLDDQYPQSAQVYQKVLEEIIPTITFIE